MDQISNDELDKIERLAAVATWGPWEHRQNPSTNSVYGNDKGAVALCQMQTPRSRANAAYIASVSPDFILRLIREVRISRRG